MVPARLRTFKAGLRTAAAPRKHSALTVHNRDSPDNRNPREIAMNATTMQHYAAHHTWQDTVASTAILLTILLGTLSGAYVVYTDSTPVASITDSTNA